VVKIEVDDEEVDRQLCRLLKWYQQPTLVTSPLLRRRLVGKRNERRVVSKFPSRCSAAAWWQLGEAQGTLVSVLAAYEILVRDGEAQVEGETST
jgi:hypothetical protein